MSQYFIYCRKSSEAEDRQILSIESQITELKRLAESRGISIAGVLTEARSAKAPGRPVFNDLIQRVYRGEAKGIICWKLDRLARNPIDGGSVIWAIKQHGLQIITPTQSFSQDEDNSILMYIEFGMAQKYIDDLSRNVKRGLKTKVEKGWYPGVAPVGYLNNKFKECGEKDLRKDPERFSLIRQMWDLMLTGNYSPPQILRTANDQWGFRTRQTKKMGGKPLVHSAIYRLFGDRFYYGWFEYPRKSGNWYKGNHDPMITEEEFNRVQVLLGRNGTARPSTHPTFPFTGLIRCGECGAAVTAEEKHQLRCEICRHKFSYRNAEKCPKCDTRVERMENPAIRHYTYYHCTKRKEPSCTQGSIEAKSLEIQIEDFLSRIQISERFKNWAIKYLHELHKQESIARTEIDKSQKTAYHACEKRLDNLIRLKTSPDNADGSLLSDAEYGKQRFELLKRKSQLDELSRSSSRESEICLSLAEKTFEFACAARSRFVSGDAKTKKQILSAVGSNLTLKGKKLFIEATKPFYTLEESLSGPSPQNYRFEPGKSGSTKGRKEPYGSLNPRGLGSRNWFELFNPQ